MIFSDSPRTFVEALRYCDSYDYFLPVPQTIEANQQLLKFGGIFYLGITDFESEGIWRSFYTGEIIPFSNWLPGQPNDLHGADYVEFFSMLGGRWNDASGESKRSTVCVKDNLVVTTTAAQSTAPIIVQTTTRSNSKTKLLSQSLLPTSNTISESTTASQATTSPTATSPITTSPTTASSTTISPTKTSPTSTSPTTRSPKKNLEDFSFDVSKNGNQNDRALAALVSWPKEIMIATATDQTATSTADSSYDSGKSDTYDSFNSVLASSDLGLELTSSSQPSETSLGPDPVFRF